MTDVLNKNNLQLNVCKRQGQQYFYAWEDVVLKVILRKGFELDRSKNDKVWMAGPSILPARGAQASRDQEKQPWYSFEELGLGCRE